MILLISTIKKVHCSHGTYLLNDKIWASLFKLSCHSAEFLVPKLQRDHTEILLIHVTPVRRKGNCKADMRGLPCVFPNWKAESRLCCVIISWFSMLSKFLIFLAECIPKSGPQHTHIRISWNVRFSEGGSGGRAWWWSVCWASTRPQVWCPEPKKKKTMSQTYWIWVSAGWGLGICTLNLDPTTMAQYTSSRFSVQLPLP